MTGLGSFFSFVFRNFCVRRGGGPQAGGYGRRRLGPPPRRTQKLKKEGGKRPNVERPVARASGRPGAHADRRPGVQTAVRAHKTAVPALKKRALIKVLGPAIMLGEKSAQTLLHIFPSSVRFMHRNGVP